jgi:Flp pilus assembly protein TadG
MRSLNTRVNGSNKKMLGFARYFDRKEKETLSILGILNEEGATLVETAISFSIVLAVFFGVVEVSYSLYSSHFVGEAAREAARYAMVRGSACVGMPDCGFTDANTTLLAYVKTLGYPGIDGTKLTVTSSWYVPATTGTLNPAWNVCASGSGCNAPGDMVKVTVQYPFVLSIPYWKSTTLNFTSSSQLVISE